MLNPKLIELYGEESRVIFEDLIKFIGEKYAPHFYVFNPDDCVSVRDTAFPQRFCNNIKRKNHVPDVHGFMQEYAQNEDTHVYVLSGWVIAEEDIPLLVGDDVKPMNDIEESAKKVLHVIGLPDLIDKVVEENNELKSDWKKEARVGAALMRIDKKLTLGVAGEILSIAGSDLMDYETGHELADWVMQKIVEDYVPNSDYVVSKYNAIDKCYANDNNCEEW